MQLSPANVNFTLCNGLCIYQGADWAVPVSISERTVSEGQITDTPVDLTGYTGSAAIKKYCGADQAIALPTVEITDAINGKILISLSAAETAALVVNGNTFRDVTTLVYDVYLTETETGEISRILMGNIDVSPAVLDGDDING